MTHYKAVADSLAAAEQELASLTEFVNTKLPTEKTIGDRIDYLKKLEVGWDGDDAEAPSPLAINNLESLMRRLVNKGIRVPSVMALDNGIVACFWRNNGSYLEIGFDKENTLYYYAKLSEIDKAHGDDIVLNDKVFSELLDLATQVLKQEG